MIMTCPNCHQLVKSTDGFCESCGYKIDTSGGSSSSSPSPSPPSLAPSSSPVTAGNIKKVCKNEKCASYNAEYGIDENYCGVCGSELALKGQEEKPPDLQKRGFLVMPDRSQIEITMTQTPIGRIHLSKYISEGDMNYISKEHITVFKEGEKYFVQDGKTTVQKKPSRNKTWLISGGKQKEEITEKGRRELKDGDQISIADAVTLSFSSR